MMRVIGCVLWLLLGGLVTLGQQGDAPQTAASQMSEDEKAIRASAEAGVAAFKNRDAAAMAALFTPDGVYVSETGEKFVGRKEIQAEYQTLFDNSPGEVELQVEIDSVRVINAQTAVEEGRSALTPQPIGETRVMSRYTALHVKQDGEWLIAELRDTQVELPPDAGRLDDLEWMVGSWVAARDTTKLEVQCRWIENRHFLARTHVASDAGKTTVGGLEIIGVDPSTGQITSWSFNNDGGLAVGVWAPHQAGWAVAATGVQNDGTPTSATNILSRRTTIR